MAEDSLAHRTVIGTGWMMAWRMVTRVLGMASTLILARLLVPADFGIVAMATIAMGAVEAMTQLGLQDALVRHPDNNRRLFNTAFTLQVLRAGIICLILLACAPLAGWWFGEPRLVPIVLILAGLTLVTGFENVGIVEFRRDMRFDRQFKLMTVPRLLQVAVTITLALVFQSYWALVAGIAVGRVGSVVASYVVHAYRPGFSLVGWRELAGFSFWIWAASLANMVWERSDAIVIGRKFGSTGLGVYALALELALLPVTELIAPATGVLFAGFAAAQNRDRSSGPSGSAVAVSLLLLVAPLVIGLSAIAGQVVMVLLGAKWSAAQPLMAILAWQGLFSPFSWVCGMQLVARGHVRLNFMGNLAAAMIRLVCAVTVVSLTDDLRVVAVVVTLVVAAEAAIFMAMLHRSGDRGLATVGGPLLRIMLASGVTVAMLLVTGLGWRSVEGPMLAALWQGALIGSAAVACFVLTALAAWRVAGCPEGPESQVLDLAGRVLRLPGLRGWRP